jgi:hypothetical protein
MKPTTKSGSAIQEAIGDLTSLQEGWNLLADTDSAEFLRQVKAEVKRLKKWVSDLQSGMYVNCVYCGYRYGPDPGTPVAMADVLKAHIAKCPEHPLSKANARLADLVTAAREFDFIDPKQIRFALQEIKAGHVKAPPITEMYLAEIADAVDYLRAALAKEGR